MEIRYRKSVIHQSVGGEDMEAEVMLPDFGDEQEQRISGYGDSDICGISENTG